jgi:hypothetical protein
MLIFLYIRGTFRNKIRPRKKKQLIKHSAFKVRKVFDIASIKTAEYLARQLNFTL